MLRVWSRFTRARLSPSALSNFGLGLLLGSGTVAGRDSLRETLLEPRALYGFGMAWLVYLFGMGLNDYWDRARDAEKHPERPLPSGRLSVRHAQLGLTVLLAGAFGLSSLIGREAILSLAGLVAGIVLYNGVTKDNAVAGPLTMGAIRGGLILAGSWVGSNGTAIPLESWLSAGVLLLYIAALTFFSLSEDGHAVSAVRVRARGVVSVGLAGATTALVASEFGSAGDPGAVALAAGAWLLFLVWYAYAPLRQDPPQVFPTTWRFLLGIFLLDSVSAAAWIGGEASLVSGAWLLVAWRPWSKRTVPPKPSASTPPPNSASPSGAGPPSG